MSHRGRFSAHRGRFCTQGTVLCVNAGRKRQKNQIFCGPHRGLSPVRPLPHKGSLHPFVPRSLHGEIHAERIHARKEYRAHTRRTNQQNIHRSQKGPCQPMSQLGRRSEDRRPQTVGQRRRCADTAPPNCQGPSCDQVYSDASSLRRMCALYSHVHGRCAVRMQRIAWRTGQIKCINPLVQSGAHRCRLFLCSGGRARTAFLRGAQESCFVRGKQQSIHQRQPEVRCTEAGRNREESGHKTYIRGSQ